MADGYTTMYDILKTSLDDRRERYGTTAVSNIVIDGNKFGGYKTFSSYWEKTYVKQPERSASGVISNLNSYPTFTTFHLKVDFAMMSIDDYRRLYQLMLSKNEFTVTAYNALTNSTYTCKMYFAPDQMPNLYMVARRLQGEGEVNKFIEILGVRDYTIELIGTNADVDEISVVYYDKNGQTLGAQTTYENSEFLLGSGISVPDVDGYTFNGTWIRSGSDVSLPTNSPVMSSLTTDAEKSSKTISYTAQYSSGKQFSLTFSYGEGAPVKDIYGNQITSIKFSPNDKVVDAIKRANITMSSGNLLSSLPTSSANKVEDKEAYVRHGWYLSNSTNGTKIEDSTLLDIENNIIIYQVFTPVKNSITFNSNGGTAISTLGSVEYNSSVALPNPVKEGKTFGGWYLDEKLTSKFNGVMKNYSITLYAKWE